MTLVAFLNGLAWGAPIEGVSNTTFGGAAGLTMGAGVLASGTLQNDTFIGGAAGISTTNGPSNTTGLSNTFVGNGAGFNNTTGNDNCFLGAFAGNGNTSGAGNSIAGRDAGSYLDTGSSNSFYGYQAGFQSTGTYNSFLGNSSGYSNTSNDNVMAGSNSGYFSAGNLNTFIGSGTGRGNLPVAGNTGVSNSFFGYQAGHSNTAGSYSVFLGAGAGFNFGFYNGTGGSSVFIGPNAGYSEYAGNRLYIDNCITGFPCTQPLIYGEFDNRIVRIDGSLTMVSVATPSDLRYKKDIHPLESSLGKVLLLRGVTYAWDRKTVNGAGYPGGPQMGLIAQEVEKVFPELVNTDSKGYKALSYDKLVPLLVEAVKEQQQFMLQQDAEQRKEIMEQQELLLGAAAEKNAEIQALELKLLALVSRLTAVEGAAGTVAAK